MVPPGKFLNSRIGPKKFDHTNSVAMLTGCLYKKMYCFGGGEGGDKKNSRNKEVTRLGRFTGFSFFFGFIFKPVFSV